jgi:hypothetical protein
MQNKSANRWLDVQIVILTLSMALSLFLWNLFAGNSRTSTSGVTANLQPAQAAFLPQPQPRVRILLGGAAPQAQVPSVSRGSSQPPAPVTITGSSR